MYACIMLCALQLCACKVNVCRVTELLDCSDTFGYWWDDSHLDVGAKRELIAGVCLQLERANRDAAEKKCTNKWMDG